MSTDIWEVSDRRLNSIGFATTVAVTLATKHCSLITSLPYPKAGVMLDQTLQSVVALVQQARVQKMPLNTWLGEVQEDFVPMRIQRLLYGPYSA